jgi:hypothetical protein
MKQNSKRPQVRSWRPVDPQMCRGRVAVNTRIGVEIKENLWEGDFTFLILLIRPSCFPQAQHRGNVTS